MPLQITGRYDTNYIYILQQVAKLVGTLIFSPLIYISRILDTLLSMTSDITNPIAIFGYMKRNIKQYLLNIKILII